MLSDDDDIFNLLQQELAGLMNILSVPVLGGNGFDGTSHTVRDGLLFAGANMDGGEDLRRLARAGKSDSVDAESASTTDKERQRIARRDLSVFDIFFPSFEDRILLGTRHQITPRYTGTGDDLFGSPSTGQDPIDLTTMSVDSEGSLTREHPASLFDVFFTSSSPFLRDTLKAAQTTSYSFSNVNGISETITTTQKRVVHADQTEETITTKTANGITEYVRRVRFPDGRIEETTETKAVDDSQVNPNIARSSLPRDTNVYSQPVMVNTAQATPESVPPHAKGENFISRIWRLIAG